MGEGSSAKRRSKKHSKPHAPEESIVPNEEPKRKAAKKKRNRENRDRQEEGVESDDVQVLNLADDGRRVKGGEDAEILLISDDADVVEVKETEDEQHGSSSKRKKAKKKRKRESRGDDGQIMNLPDDDRQPEYIEDAEIQLISDDPDIAEVKETEDEQCSSSPKRKKGKRKRNRKTRGPANLQDNDRQPEYSDDVEMWLISDDPDVVEVRETGEEQRGCSSKRERSEKKRNRETTGDDSQILSLEDEAVRSTEDDEQHRSSTEDSEDESGDSSESDFLEQSEDESVPVEQKIGFHTKKALHQRLARGVQKAELEDDYFWIEKIKDLTITMDWEIPPLHQIQNSIKHLTRDEQEELKNEGISIRKGAWSLEEDRKLAQNWIRFSEEYDIRNPLCLLGLKPNSHTPKHQGVDFVKYLGQGLAERPLMSIYQRARRLLDPGNFRGRFTKSEWEKLKLLLAKYGNKWTMIAHLMDRSAESLKDYHKVHYKDYNQGKWQVKEDKRLFSAITRATGGEDLTTVHHNLPWMEVSKLVKTRNPAQCFVRWMYIVSWTICGKLSRTTWKTEDKIRLIETLRDSAYQTEMDIPWHSMYKDFGLVNCFQLRSKFNDLRVRVPRYYIKPYQEILDWLVEYRLPLLERKAGQRTIYKAKVNGIRKLKYEEKVRKRRLRYEEAQRKKKMDEAGSSSTPTTNPAS